ncbi:MAG: hypothetical protein R6V50_00615 [Thermoplasmatota archaeon]
MKKHNVILILIMLVLVAIFSGCIGEQTNEKDKFIGTWRAEGGETAMEFEEDDIVSITGAGPFGNIELTGKFKYLVADKQITFSPGELGITFDYRFPSDTELVLTNQQGLSLTLIKQN